MTPRDVFTMVLRALGFLAALRLVTYVVAVYGMAEVLLSGAPAGSTFYPGAAWSGGDFGFAVALAAQIGLHALIAGLLIFAAPRISAFFYRGTDATEEAAARKPLTIAHYYRIGVQLLGLYSLLRAIGPMARLLAQVPRGDGIPLWDQIVIPDLLQAVLYLAAAAYLVLGSRGLARLLARLQYQPPERVTAVEHCCVYCGYDLRGLSKPRCPECGREFDKRLLETAEAGVE